MNRIALALCAALVALSCNAGDSTTLGALPAVNPRIVTEGTACSGTGLQGMNTAGLILSCQSGVWRLLGISNVERVSQYAFIDGLPLPRLVDITVTCPAGKRVVSGGCNFNGYSTEVNLDDSSPGVQATTWNCSVKVGSVYKTDPWTGVEASAICAYYGG